MFQRVALTVPLMLLGACAGESPTEPQSGAASLSTQNTAEPTYAVHEWGLIDVQFGPLNTQEPLESGSGNVRALTGAGHFIGGFGLGFPQTTGLRGRKPVLYVHLGPGVEALDFEAEVRVPGGRLPEHWPPATEHAQAAEGHRIRWTGRAENRSCQGLDYPANDSPRCVAAEPYCEVAELGLYETDDGACVVVGETDSNHLFYRADITEALPLRIRGSLMGYRFGLENTTDHILPGRLLLISRATNGVDTSVAYVDMPGPGETAIIETPELSEEEGAATAERRTSFEAEHPDLAPGLPAPVGQSIRYHAAEAIMEEIDTHLTTVGLTTAERAAFARAWTTELTGGLDPRRPRQTTRIQEAPVASSSHALLYWLGPEDAQRLLPLRFFPEPTAVRRGLLVRLNLGRRAFAHAHHSLRVRRGRVEATGGHGNALRRVLRRHLLVMHRCAEEHGAMSRVFDTRFTLAGELGATGELVEFRVESEPPGFEALIECLHTRLRSMTFPESLAGTRFEAPFSLARDR